jgi:FkbM family methyltransferase
MLRTLAERLSRGRIIKRRLPREFGRTALFVSPDAQLKYLKPGAAAFDEGLLRLAKETVRADSVVWDIGANVGVFSFAAASLATKGSVLAVEPDIWLARIVRRSASLKKNRTLGVRVLAAAASNANGVATFLIAGRGRASSALEAAGGRSEMGGIRERVVVPTLTLDTLLEHFDRPSVVKIDVEGAEDLVLEGAGKLLSDVRPTLLIEVGSEARGAATRILRKAGYVLFDGDLPPGERVEIPDCAFNTLAVPR